MIMRFACGVESHAKRAPRPGAAGALAADERHEIAHAEWHRHQHPSGVVVPVDERAERRPGRPRLPEPQGFAAIVAEPGNCEQRDHETTRDDAGGDP
jgi:hypothetical protein